ncbi:ArsA family ATPase [Paramaledivibacter caminithermalis]|jgi:arsenite-transporting ATPase|uniref:Arsenite-transporting ATPase n=1 Tax=Paramaledivibacter caminithermalis (strain DSM 15212 / CIP 107654 / DViRD3) TaxID=1121301 RepID=A0A1M6MI94_PARC5|nr:ArsA family ATPase [Paramaledivibacter caminithermalis]SHJ83003.1 arsenite-transporting ATPase [Paramaledivibacter caminithermalis DSM 15212]
MGKIIFFGGKGGVGKTSCSTAFALSKARSGLKTLLVSTDPAHSISDLFHCQIEHKITQLEANLFGVEVNPERESNAYITKIRKNLHSIMSPIIMEELNKQLDAASVSPGTHESALFDKMIEIIIDTSKDFDYIVFDTAPTGHTLRLLSLPEMLGAWMDSLIAKRKKTLTFKSMLSKDKGIKDPIIEILSKRRNNLTLARKIMIDGENLQFIFVLNAEKMPIEETKKAVKMLRSYGIKVTSLVVNKILPNENSDDFWKDKKVKETRYLKIIEEEIPVDNLYQIPLFKFDMDEYTINEMAEYF